LILNRIFETGFCGVAMNRVVGVSRSCASMRREFRWSKKFPSLDSKVSRYWTTARRFTSILEQMCVAGDSRFLASLGMTIIIGMTKYYRNDKVLWVGIDPSAVVLPSD